jgi:hypothetical protein
VHYDTSGTNVPSLLDGSRHILPNSQEGYVDSALQIANQVFSFETGTLMFAAPPGDGTAGGGPEYDIYIVDFGSGLYGETMPDSSLDTRPDGGRWTTFISIDKDFSWVSPDSDQGLPALRVTLAHEFHHAIQIGQYGYWQSEIYFHELTSVWMETMTFPDVPDYLNYLRSRGGGFAQPSKSFTQADGTIEYSHGIWGIFLAARFSTEIMRLIWEDIRQDSPLRANDVVLRRTEFQSSLRQAFAEWSLWNYFTSGRADPSRYYPRGALYPRVAAVGIDFSQGSGQGSYNATLPPLASRYYEVSASADTSCLIVANLNDATALDPQPPQYPYAFTLSRSANDEAFEPVGGICFYKTLFPDPSNWKTSTAGGGGSVVVSGIRDGTPFPNPFHADGTNSVSIPGHGPAGIVRIYDSAMRLVCESRQQPSLFLAGKTVYRWDGRRDDGRLAASGIYFFTLELSDGVLRGKVALLRNGP